MNAQAFSELVKNPGLLSNYSLGELQELAHRHPYASVVYSMIALKAHLENDGNSEHYLSQAAIRIPDRKKLFHLIHAEYDMDVPPVETKQERPQPEPPIQQEPEKKIEPEVVAAPTPVEPIQEEPAPVEQPEEPLPARAGLKTLREIKMEKPLDLPGMDEVEAALNSISSFKPEPRQAEEVIETKEPPVAREEKKPVATGSEHSFSEWLSLMKQGLPVPQAATNEPLKEEPIDMEKFEFEAAPATDEEKDIDEIMISQQAKASITGDDELVTETLAKIYEMQRKYEKAIQAYEKLSLKYPEKSTYFADKIQTLKNK